MKTKHFTVRRIVLDAVMVAMYNALALLSLTLGGLKISLEALPVVVCAVLFGPADAAMVGGLGEFMNQMLTYGFTATTLLWVFPAVARGLLIGLCLKPLKKNTSLEDLFRGKRMVAYYAICLLSAVLVSCCNTFTLYVDSNLYGYYSYAMVFGSFILRILTGLVSTSVMATITIPLALAVKRAKLI